MKKTTDPGLAYADNFFYGDYIQADDINETNGQISMFGKNDAALHYDMYAWEADFSSETIARTALPACTGKLLSFDEFYKKVGKEDAEELKRQFTLADFEERRTVDTNIKINKLGTERSYSIRGTVFRCATGVYASGAACDVENARTRFEYLEYLKTHDYLTGFDNMDALERLNQSEDCLYPYSIVIACVDNLRDINDSLGYYAGNDLIKNVAEAIRECFADSDCIVRLGGGEFCAVFSGKDDLEIEMMISEANMMIHKMYLNLIKTEVSFGYAISGDMSDFYSLYRQAAARMKRSRKLRRILSGESVVDRLSDIIGAKTGWGNRTKRLQGLAARIAEELGCTNEQINEIKALAKVADIGHIALPDSLLSQRNDNAYESNAEYRKHVEAGRALISQIDELSDMENAYLDIYRRYDEWQEGISLPARIVAAAIGFDDISLADTARIKNIIASMEAEKGTRYCPRVVDAIVKITNRHLLVQYRAMI